MNLAETDRPRPEIRVSGAIDLAARRLAATGVERPRAEAELIAAEGLGRRREWLVTHPEAALSEAEVRRVEALVERRAGREPLAYVLGHTEFYSLDFLTSRAAIVPRPETEVLVEATVARARKVGARLALDVGTGCGAVAAALGREVAGLRVIGTDASVDALRLARENCRRLGVADRVSLVCCDLLAGIGGRAHCIAANLPYIRRDEFAGLVPEVRDFEPRAGLDGGEDGLEAIGRVSVQLRGHLWTGGFAALEVGAGQAEEVAKLVAAGGLSRVEVVADYGGIERVVIGWREG